MNKRQCDAAEQSLDLNNVCLSNVQTVKPHAVKMNDNNPNLPHLHDTSGSCLINSICRRCCHCQSFILILFMDQFHPLFTSISFKMTESTSCKCPQLFIYLTGDQLSHVHRMFHSCEIILFFSAS